MLTYLLDTNIIIYTLKNRPQQVKRRFQNHHGRMCISAVTLGELVFGAEHSQQVERNLADIEAMVARLEVLPFDNKAAYHFGQIRAALYRTGPPSQEIGRGLEASPARPPNVAGDPKRSEGPPSQTIGRGLEASPARPPGVAGDPKRSEGPPIGPYDMMIAGQARAFGLILVTNNKKEFERVPGLVLEDWSEA